MANMIDRFNTEEEVDNQKEKYLTFLLQNQLYAFPISNVIEIIEMQEITAVPEFPYYVKGIINLRGKIFPIIDVRLRFHKQEAEYTERTCIIIVSVNDAEIGFIVDTVDEVIDIDDSEISPPPKVSGDSASKYVVGVAHLQEGIVLILEAAKLLNEKDIDILKNI